MIASSADQGNDRMFCWEQVSRTNRLFRVSRVFAANDCAEKLLPLYALFSAVEQISATVTDVGVATSKLSWWRSECLHKSMSESQHPIVRELARTGAANSLPGERIAELFDGAEQRLSAIAPADMGALKNRCMEMYRTQLQLELSLTGSQISADDFRPGLIASNGLFQLVRESTRRKEQGAFWWIPLNSLARHGISRGEILSEPDKPEVIQLFSDVLTAGISWGEGRGGVQKTRRVELSPARHVFAISSLYARKLRSLLDTSPQDFIGRMEKLWLPDLLRAWASARQLR